MRTLVWSATFARAFKRMSRHQRQLTARTERALKQLAEDPFHPSLRTHKLKARLAGSWACSAGYDLRVVFQFVKQKGVEAILLEAVGTHDEVY